MSLTSILEIALLVVEVVFGFGLIILFHELGHFVVAKLSGVAAPEFAFGMGPELFGFDRGGTRYKVCLFPIGGYVKMVGEDEGGPDETPETPPEQNFQYKSTPVKVAIIAAGPIMNIVLGFILFTGIFMAWGVERGVTVEKLSNSVIVDLVDPRKPAGEAGLKKGDRLVAADGIKALSTKHFNTLIRERPGKKTALDVLRGRKLLRIDVVPEADSKHGWGVIGVGIRAPFPRELRTVAKGGPAWRAGLRKGDVILDFNGLEFLEEKYPFDGAVDVLVGKGKEKPRRVRIEAKPGETELGADFHPLMEKTGFGKSISYGVTLTGRNMRLVADILYMLVSNKVSVKEVAGPVGIIQYSVYFAKIGLRDFIYFMGFISVNLAVLNLVPFPALDGSRIAIHIWEGLRGKPLDQRRVGIVHYAGFMVLIALIVVVTLKDILHWVR